MKSPEENLILEEAEAQEPESAQEARRSLEAALSGEEPDPAKIAKIATLAEEAAEQPDPANIAIEEEVHEAYLRGRNEAIAEALGRDGEHPLTAPRNHTPGIEDPYTPPSDPALAAIFTFRPSVWE